MGIHRIYHKTIVFLLFLASNFQYNNKVMILIYVLLYYKKMDKILSQVMSPAIGN